MEPDEKAINKAKTSTKLKIHAAGSFANIVVAFIVLLISTLVVTSLFVPGGFVFQTVEDSPANMTGLSGALVWLGGQKINSIEDINNTLSQYKPGEVVQVVTAPNNWMVPTLSFNGSLGSIMPRLFILTDFNETETYNIALAEHPDFEGRAYLGISNMIQTNSIAFPMSGFLILSMLFLWLFIFSLGIGLINLMPMKPFDGGLIMEDILEKTKRKKLTAAIVRIVSTFMLLLILFNLIGPVFFMALG